MFRSVILAALVVLVGCNTPGPGFRGVAPTRITVGQSVFDVRVTDARAEAIRVNPEWAPNLDAVAPRARIAIETVSGCTIRRLGGDQAKILALLDC